MIQIHIESPTVEALQGELSALLGGMIKGTVKDLVAAVPHAEIGIEPEKAADPTEEAAPVETPEEAAPIETPEEAAPAEDPPTMEETRAALNALRAKKGPAAVREILNAHNVKSFVDLKPSEYATVIKEAAAHV